MGVATASAGLALAGCGGGERQDENEASGSFRMDVSDVSFPTSQRLAEQSTFAITVRNAGQEEIPNLAVTLRGFSARPAASEDRSGSAAIEPQSDPDRPVWIVDDEPSGGATAYDETWSAGRLAAGRSTTLRWKVTPVVPGKHMLRYEVAAGLDGKARAAGVDGRPPQGALEVDIDREPSASRVDPATGDVVRSGDSG